MGEIIKLKSTKTSTMVEIQGQFRRMSTKSKRSSTTTVTDMPPVLGTSPIHLEINELMNEVKRKLENERINSCESTQSERSYDSMTSY